MIGAIWFNDSVRTPDGYVSHLNGTETNGRSFRRVNIWQCRWNVIFIVYSHHTPSVLLTQRAGCIVGK